MTASTDAELMRKLVSTGCFAFVADSEVHNLIRIAAHLERMADEILSQRDEIERLKSEPAQGVECWGVGDGHFFRAFQTETEAYIHRRPCDTVQRGRFVPDEPLPEIAPSMPNEIDRDEIGDNFRCPCCGQHWREYAAWKTNHPGPSQVPVVTGQASEETVSPVGDGPSVSELEALDCVDRAFRILPDFCYLGESKFKAVIRLAEAYSGLMEKLKEAVAFPARDCNRVMDSVCAAIANASV